MADYVEWLRKLSATGGKGVMNNIDARSLGHVADQLVEKDAKIARLRKACEAGLAYDAAIFRRGQDGDVESLARGAIAMGDDLDALYDSWISAIHAALAEPPP
jgi:hypothetical protein